MAIFYSLEFEREGRFPVFISSRIRVSQFYAQELDSVKMGVHQEIHVS
jgi:hypothetical protein